MFREEHAIDPQPAITALAGLCDPFGGEEFTQRGVEVVDGPSMPEPYRGLLVHQGHMTATLKRYHGCEVELRVLSFCNEWPWYRRKIILTLPDSPRVVEFGIVRLDLRVLADPVREEVLERSRPLGDILNSHRVLTRVEPRWFLRFGSESAIEKYLKLDSSGACYGRLATIHCDGAAAIDLLEVVTDYGRTAEGDRLEGRSHTLLIR